MGSRNGPQPAHGQSHVGMRVLRSLLPNNRLAARHLPSLPRGAGVVRIRFVSGYDSDPEWMRETLAEYTCTLIEFETYGSEDTVAVDGVVRAALLTDTDGFSSWSLEGSDYGAERARKIIISNT